MVKLVLAVSLFVAVATCNVIQPRDLAHEADLQYSELMNTVSGAILAGHSELGMYHSDFGFYARNSLRQGVVALQLGQDTIDQQLQAIKDLAAAAHVDISSCTNVREEVLNNLPARFERNMTDCATLITQEVTMLTDRSRYTIDVTMNTVYNLRYRLDRCEQNLLCISPILTEIELDKIRLPQSIKTEALATQSLLNTLKINVDNCSTSMTAQYTTEANSVLADIAACANRIIG